MFDADVLIGHYPFRQFPYASTDLQWVKEHLQSRGIRRACVASLNAFFYADPQQGDREVFPQAAGDSFFLPVGTVNPSLHNWGETLRRCVEQYGCRMVRLIPNYHRYRLFDPFVFDFLEKAHSYNVVVCIVKRVEDERMHHLLMKVPAVENDLIAEVARRYPYPLVVLSAYLNEIKDLARTGAHVHFDIALAETMNTMKRLCEHIVPERLLFSSHSPFLYPEAAIGKISHWETAEENRRKVREGNLSLLLG